MDQSSPDVARSSPCDTCQGLFRRLLGHLRATICQPRGKDEREDKDLWMSHVQGADLRHSASQGCPLCRDFYDSLVVHTIDPHSMRFEMTLMDPTISPSTWGCGVMALMGGGSYEIRSGPRELPLFPVAKMNIEPPIQLIHTWLKACYQNHKRCKPSPHGRLPTRLLDVCQSMTFNTIRIIETEGLSLHSTSYIALSHCWGKDRPRVLTLQVNIERHKRSIHVESLGQTFKDAITVTRFTNHRYLWIDTLCIIQDDELDWQKESSRMHEIYNNAAFTIAASDSLDSEAGFLGERKKPRYSETSFVVADGEGSSVPFHIRKLSEGANGPLERRFIGPKALDERAWTLQELLLSNKYISFGSEQMSMQCPSAYFYERSHYPVHPTQRGQYSVPISDFLRSAAKPDGHLASYQELVSCFTRRFITYADDRLPAFSGLAKHYCNGLNDRLLAALREQSLLQDLCWLVDTREQHVKRSRELHYNHAPRLRVPSWSWASCPYPVLYNFYQTEQNFVDTATVCNAFVNLVGKDSAGQVDGGMIELEGPMFECIKRGGNQELAEAWDLNETSGSFAIPSLDHGDDRARERIVCMILRHSHDFERWEGLVIEPLQESVGGKRQYRRVGMIYANARILPPVVVWGTDVAHKLQELLTSERVRICLV